MTRRTDVLLDGLAFAEGPRWRDGKLWFSDMHQDVVMTVDLDGKNERIVDVPEQPSGLGWLPDGRMLVVSMKDRRLLRLDPEGLVEVADLSAHATWHCNDMVVDEAGRAYVGNFGSEIHGGSDGTPEPTVLCRVDPDGTVAVAARDLMFPNGTVITPDGHTLIVGETFAARLTAFDLDPSTGDLSNRRVWAPLRGAVPDGICLDAEGAIWVASPVSREVQRVAEGGEVLDRVKVENQAYACMLGGDDGQTLFVCTAADSDPGICRATPTGRIEIARVDAPGAGLP
ncbi:MAG: SMP-30/gluconolactonase/LRE family protein [Deltaproteobacteria bacterium]|nr:SMP-30/gluconolactonase/LRE family protein [Deltaproteobacteria bacterium]MBW2448024.1 SMP-30/gluconolactonase/LRE family protein [Deltaproteobacteria bacterium]